MRILITRPMEDASATAQILRARGHEPVVAPLIEIRFRENAVIPQDVQAILATSANGIRAFAKNTARRNLRVFAVGMQTADAAKQEGFADVLSADGDAGDLAKLVKDTAMQQSGPLLHAAGAQTRGDLGRTLQQAGFSVRSVTLYDAVATRSLPPDVILSELDAALFYSPRSAATFAGLARAAACDKILACCISAATADALKPLHFREVRVAARPNQECLLALLR